MVAVAAARAATSLVRTWRRGTNTFTLYCDLTGMAMAVMSLTMFAMLLQQRQCCADAESLLRK